MPAPTSNIIPSPNPAIYAIAVTPSDSVNLAPSSRALYVGGAGNVALVQPDDTVVTFVGVTAGFILPVACKRVNSTNTTATSIVALY